MKHRDVMDKSNTIIQISLIAVGLVISSLPAFIEYRELFLVIAVVGFELIFIFPIYFFSLKLRRLVLQIAVTVGYFLMIVAMWWSYPPAISSGLRYLQMNQPSPIIPKYLFLSVLVIIASFEIYPTLIVRNSLSKDSQNNGNTDV